MTKHQSSLLQTGSKSDLMMSFAVDYPRYLFSRCNGLSKALD